MPSNLSKIILSLAVTLVSLAVAFLLVHSFAPHLIRAPEPIIIDTELVQVDERVPPFFENVFRGDKPVKEGKPFLRDPHTLIRGVPLLPRLSDLHQGPHDILGFRNPSVPNEIDVFVFGDSQTYGTHVEMEESWPWLLSEQLSEGGEKRTVYNASLGGWGPVRYLYVFGKLRALRPKVLVVAVYTGNDALEAFSMVKTSEAFSDLLPDRSLEGMDRPERKRSVWPVQFKGAEKKMRLTPGVRAFVNEDRPDVNAGYAIIHECARRIARMAKEDGIPVLFTIIPTRETAVLKRIRQDGIALDPLYEQLVTDEARRVREMVAVFETLPGATCVDLTPALQDAVANPNRLATEYYRGNLDGHPKQEGSREIASILAPTVRKLLEEADKARE